MVTMFGRDRALSFVSNQLKISSGAGRRFSLPGPGTVHSITDNKSMEPGSLFEHISLVLHRPRFAENIGATARAAWNMGFSKIILVNPEDTDWERMNQLSTHVARGLLERMEIFSDLAEALGPFQYIFGTTGRFGGQRKTVLDPSQAAAKIVSLGRGTRIALLFGPENRGLSNAELRFCQATVSIPTARPGSLNLAQAALIFCYEILLAHRKSEVAPSPLGDEIPRMGFTEDPSGGRRAPRKAVSPEPAAQGRGGGLPGPSPLATSFELEGMYGHLSEVLQLLDFLDPQNPDHWMMSLRRFFSRIELTGNEVRMIRGICRQLKWFILRHRSTPPSPPDRGTP